MKLYSYIVTHDTGFAPNPFWGFCTLACCKPKIRKAAQKGDWIVGLSEKAKGNRIIYVMRVDEKLTFAEYFRDSRFTAKIPDFSKAKEKKEIIFKCGDNIYKPLPGGNFQQLQSMHSKNTDEDLKQKQKDLEGKYVLISETFYYFGSKSIALPEDFSELKVGRGYKSNFSADFIKKFLDFIHQYTQGVYGPPTVWPKNDDSWRKYL